MRWRGGALALPALALAVPAGAQTAEQDYQAGVAARLGGNPDEALRRLARAAEAEPGNADIHLQIGLAHLAANRLDAADAAFRRTLDLAPDYADARLGLARVAQRRGETDAALAQLEQVDARHAEAGALRRQIEAAAAARPWRWRIDLDGGYTSVDGQPDWRAASLIVQRRAGPGTVVAVTAEATRRFERSDLYGELRVDHRFARGGNVHVLIGGTPDADHRPRHQLGAGAAVRTHGGPYATVLRLDLRQADYRSGDVQTVTPGLEQYLGGRAWLTVQWINVWDRFTHSAGWLVRGDVMPNARLRLFAGAADAPDLESGRVIDTRSLFGGVVLDTGDHLSVRLSLAHEDPEGPADRNTIAIGLGYRF